MRWGWLTFMTLSVAFGLLTGCGTILGIADFSPAGDGDGGTDGMDSGATSDIDSGQLDSRSESAPKSDGASDSREGRDAGLDGDSDSEPTSDAGLDGQLDSRPDVTTADVNGEPSDGGNADANVNEAGCPLSASSTGDGGGLNWAAQFGVTGSTLVRSLALDPTSSDVVLTGNFTDRTNFGGGIVTGGGGFLARFDSAGGYKWAQVFSGAGVVPASVAVNGVGDALITGSFDGTANFAGQSETSTTNGDSFLAEFNSGGDFMWAKHFGNSPSVCCAALGAAVFDSSGDVYVVGKPRGNAVDLGCGAMPSASSEFVAELDGTGACVWSHGYGPYDASDSTEGSALTVDSAGNVLVAGGFVGTIDFGNGPMTAPSVGMTMGVAVFIQKFTAGGALTWVKTFGSGGSSAEVTGIAADACDDILIDGTFSQTIDFGGETTPLSESVSTALMGAGDIFLAKLDPSGNGIWSESFGDPNEQSGGPLAVDSLGGPAITGAFFGTVNFGGGTLQSATLQETDTSMYIAKFNSAGTYEWAYGGGPPASNAPNTAGDGIAANASVVVTAGTLQGGTLALPGDTLTAASITDVYLASFAH